jgi:hypothetical protein
VGQEASKETIARLYKRVNPQTNLAFRVKHSLTSSKNGIDMGVEYRPSENVKYHMKISDEFLLDIAAKLKISGQVKINLASKVRKFRLKGSDAF